MERVSVISRHLTAAEQQVTHPAPTLIVAGGLVLDVQACADREHALQRGGSVPGSVRQVPGGVARNIAEAASRLLAPSLPPPALLSVVGEDAAGQALLHNLATLRVDASGVQRQAGMPTATVCAVLDSTGEVACCVADVAGLEAALTPQRLTHMLAQALDRSTSSPPPQQQHQPPAPPAPAPAAAARRLTQHHHHPQQPLLVVEANLSEPSLRAACALAAARGVPVLLEPVSVPKARRAARALPHLHWVTPNANELVALADEVRAQAGLPALPRPCARGDEAPLPAGWPRGVPAEPLQGLLPFAACVLRAGARRVVLTLGAQGAALLRLAGRGGGAAVRVTHLPALPAEVESLSGAGDTLVGGLAAALLRQGGAGSEGDDQGDVRAVAVGVAAARATVGSAFNVCPDLAWEALQRDAEAVVRTAATWTWPTQGVRVAARL